MIFEDDDIKAAANRLRASGWTEKTPEGRPALPSRRHRRPRARDRGLGILDGKVRMAGAWLAENIDSKPVLTPIRQFIADKFGLSFDDAGRAVAEASRLSGVQL